MANAVQRLRQREIAKLERAFAACAERILAYRAEHPVVQICDFGMYIDGSSRQVIKATGGFVTPSYHLWQVGYLFDIAVYIYEEIDYKLWRASGVFSEEQDTGVLKLAAIDRSVTMYHNHGVYVGEVKLEKLLDNDTWSIDTIVAVREALSRFYTPTDVKRRIKEFRKEVHHEAHALL